MKERTFKTVNEGERAGLIFHDVYDAIAYWHNHDTGNEVNDFLGWTKDEYLKWLEDETLPERW